MQHVVGDIGIDNIGIYFRDGPFSSDIGIVKLPPSKGSHWVLYNNEDYFDSYGCVCPKRLSKIIIKRNRYCSFSDYKTQGLTSKTDSYCASYCLYIIY